MRVKVKLAMETLSERHAFDDLAAKYDVKSKLSYDKGVWAEMSGPDSSVMSLMCDLCNNLVAE